MRECLEKKMGHFSLLPRINRPNLCAITLPNIGLILGSWKYIYSDWVMVVKTSPPFRSAYAPRNNGGPTECSSLSPWCHIVLWFHRSVPSNVPSLYLMEMGLHTMHSTLWHADWNAYTLKSLHYHNTIWHQGFKRNSQASWRPIEKPFDHHSPIWYQAL